MSFGDFLKGMAKHAVEHVQREAGNLEKARSRMGEYREWSNDRLISAYQSAWTDKFERVAVGRVLEERGYSLEDLD